MRNLKILLILGACALVPSATALAQCSGACGPGVCPSLPYTGPTACFPPPAATCTVGPVTFVNQTTLSWPAGDLACAPLVYDVAIGDLACLKGTCALDQTCPACLALENNDTDTMAVDASDLAPGQAVWYLVRVDAQSWNSGGAGQCSDYDAVLTGACP